MSQTRFATPSPTLRVHRMQMMGRHGDITIGWDATNRDAMLAFVEAKMAQGYVFFIIESEDRHIRLRRIEQLAGATQVLLADMDAEVLLRKAAIGLVPDEDTYDVTDIEATHRATTPDEVVNHDSVMVRGPAGG